MNIRYTWMTEETRGKKKIMIGFKIKNKRTDILTLIAYTVFQLLKKNNVKAGKNEEISIFFKGKTNTANFKTMKNYFVKQVSYFF